MENDNILIDNTEFVNHQIDYSFSHGFSFGAPARIASSFIGFFFLIAFLSALLNFQFFGSILALIFLLPLSFVITTTTGVQLSIHSKYYKPYTSYLGIKSGKWKSTRAYTDIAILTIRNSKVINNGFGAGGIKVEDVETGVYFLIPTHRKRILIKVCKSKAQADESAKKLAVELEKNLRIFNPKVSEATKARRR